MTKLGQNMSVRGTTAARFAQRAQKEEAAPGWKGNWKGNPKSDHYAISKADRVEESGREAHAEANRGGGKDPRGARNNPMKYRARQTLAAPGIVSFDARSSDAGAGIRPGQDRPRPRLCCVTTSRRKQRPED